MEGAGGGVVRKSPNLCDALLNQRQLLLFSGVLIRSRHPGQAGACWGQVCCRNKLVLDLSSFRIPDCQAAIVGRQGPVLAVGGKGKLLWGRGVPNRCRCHLIVICACDLKFEWCKIWRMRPILRCKIVTKSYENVYSLCTGGSKSERVRILDGRVCSVHGLDHSKTNYG